MKKPAIFFLLLLHCGAANSQQTAGFYSVSGSLYGMKGTVDKILINYLKDNITITDTVPVVNAKFSFSRSLPEPVKARMFVEFAPPIANMRDWGKDALTVFIQPNVTVSITCLRDSFVNAEINGGLLNQEWLKIENEEKRYYEQYSYLFKCWYDAFKNNQHALADSLIKAQMAVFDAIDQNVYKKYVVNHPASPIAVFVLKDYARHNFNAAVLEALFNKLPVYQQNYIDGKQLKSQIIRNTN